MIFSHQGRVHLEWAYHLRSPTHTCRRLTGNLHQGYLVWSASSCFGLRTDWPGVDCCYQRGVSLGLHGKYWRLNFAFKRPSKHHGRGCWSIPVLIVEAWSRGSYNRWHCPAFLHLPRHASNPIYWIGSLSQGDSYTSCEKWVGWTQSKLTFLARITIASLRVL